MSCVSTPYMLLSPAVCCGDSDPAPAFFPFFWRGFSETCTFSNDGMGTQCMKPMFPAGREFNKIEGTSRFTPIFLSPAPYTLSDIHTRLNKPLHGAKFIPVRCSNFYLLSRKEQHWERWQALHFTSTPITISSCQWLPYPHCIQSSRVQCDWHGKFKL